MTRVSNEQMRARLAAQTQQIIDAELVDLLKNKAFVRFMLRLSARAGIYFPNYQTDNRVFANEGRRALGLEVLTEAANALKRGGGEGIFTILEREGELMQAQQMPPQQDTSPITQEPDDEDDPP